MVGCHECLSILLAHGAEMDKHVLVSVVMWSVLNFTNLLIGFSNHLSVYIKQDGYSALMIAAAKGHHECLSILLAHGAEVDRPNEASVVMWSLLYAIVSLAINNVFILNSKDIQLS